MDDCKFPEKSPQNISLFKPNTIKNDIKDIIIT